MSKGERKLLKRRLAGAWVSSVVSISLVLLLIGVASLLLVNASSVSEYFKESLQVSVLLKENVSEKEAEDYCEALGRNPYVHSTKLVTREEGEAQMKEMLGEDFLKVFETSPIPISVDLSLESEYVSVDSMKVILSELESSPLVDEVESRQLLVEALNANLAKLSLILSVFIGLLLFISLVLIGNTVRLSVFSQRFVIHTMRQVGATKNFIRKPFLGKAVVQGLVGAFFAILFLMVAMAFLKKSFSQIFGLVRSDSLIMVSAIIVACGILICVACTWVVVGRLVGLNKNELYG